jgi:hypothetical protein
MRGGVSLQKALIKFNGSACHVHDQTIPCEGTGTNNFNRRHPVVSIPKIKQFMPSGTQQQYMILVSYYGNMFQHFFRPSSSQRTLAKGTISAYYVLWDPIVCFWRDSPQWARASSFTRFLDHTRRTTVGRTPLYEWSARRRDFYLKTQHSQQTSMPPLGFEPSLSRRPATDLRLWPRGHWDWRDPKVVWRFRGCYLSSLVFTSLRKMETVWSYETFAAI